jgi:hypothetical protein
VLGYLNINFYIKLKAVKIQQQRMPYTEWNVCRKYCVRTVRYTLHTFLKIIGTFLVNYRCYIESNFLVTRKLYCKSLIRPPLWSSGQNSWLQIRRTGFDSRHYQKKKVVGLERGALSLVSTTEELLDRKVAAPV